MSDNKVGIVGFGGYVPRLRLQRSAIAAAHSWFNPALSAYADGERAMANWDEDSVTMAVAAARDCLGGSGIAQPKAIVLASTSHPFKDRQNSVLVKEALNVGDSTAALDVSGSRRAGTTALLTALSQVPTPGEPVLCIGSEKLRVKPASEEEFLVGDGAAAIALGDDQIIAEFIGSHTVSVDFVDHVKQDGSEFDYVWESRWIRDHGYGKIAVDAIGSALEKHSLLPAEVDHFIFSAPMRGASQYVAKRVGLDQASIYQDLHLQMGWAGSAHSLIALSHCLENARPDACILLAGFGQGCDVLLFRVSEGIEWFRPRLGVQAALERGRSEANYLKYLVFNDLLSIEKGMRAEADQKTAMSALYRDRKAVFALVGGRCEQTGTVQFPKTRISVNQDQVALDTQRDYCFADINATILTFTADRLAYSIDPPAYYGSIEFAGGGRMMADFTDMEPEDAVKGRTMRMEFRIKARDEVRGFTRYFWKAVPLRDES